MKRRLTQDQEFSVMRLVLDKFLWIGLGILLFGFYNLAVVNDIMSGISWIVAGAVVLMLFVFIIIKHYEITPI